MRVRSALVASAAALAILAGMTGTEDAEANGDTRTLNIYHEHTKESAQITFKRNGSYDQEALKQLNWLLRDWRLDEPTRMEPRLFDIVWEVYREVGAAEPIHVVSAYRSPETNAMLRRRSKAVAEHSQHMLGHAMDFYLPDVAMSRVREVGMRLQDGGVGFYPNAYNPFVHLDAGSVRSWPRMSQDQLARLFPDGRTVHMPREGRPMPGYELAKAEILARGGTVAGTTYADGSEDTGPRKSLWAMLFGGGEDEDVEFYRTQPRSGRTASRGGSVKLASAGTNANLLAASSSGAQEDGGARGFTAAAAAISEAAVATPVSRTRSGRPILTATATPAPAPQPAPVVAPPVVASAPNAAPVPDAPTAAVARAIRLLDTAPAPPRRPSDLDTLLAASVPMPPARPVQVAALAGASVLPARLAGEMAPARLAAQPAPAPAADDRAALRTLFEAAATPVGQLHRASVTTSRTRADPMVATAFSVEPGRRLKMEFTSARLEPGEGMRFSGPAVARLATIP